jgi:hypothetical protein
MPYSSGLQTRFIRKALPVLSFSISFKSAKILRGLPNESRTISICGRNLWAALEEITIATSPVDNSTTHPGGYILQV